MLSLEINDASLPSSPGIFFKNNDISVLITGYSYLGMLKI
jgi:hypothetical protein